ncbi:hypothetical protein ACGFIF_16720 [Kribbella sp. NPDC049174]|uniref:hypothetical protein n=1 Tax=Kribbella sp. NPDC049174 TaxID=3364112 RepID=UPI00372200CF
MDSEDVRRRPVVLQTRGDDPQTTRRPYLAWVGTGLLGLVAAAGLVAGGTAVWSAFDPGTPGQSPAPLWFPPPETIRPQSDRVTPTPDDHGGDRTRTPKPTGTESSKGTSRTTEPGDDKSSGRSTTAPSDDESSGRSTTEPGDDNGGDRSGKSTEDNSGRG